MVAPARLLFVCFGDNQYHDHGAIGVFLKTLLADQGFAVSFSDDPGALEPGALSRCDAVVMYAVGAVAPPAALDHLFKAVNGERPNDRGRPVAFAGIHGVTVSFQDSAEFKRLVGASFVSHPEMGPAIEFSIKDAAHPVTAGVRDFRLSDELYCFDYHSPFTTLVSCLHENIERPVVWTRQYGQGRVFYLALGHGVGQMTDPNFQTLLVNGIRWSVAGE
jgi:type 1 glutamine amidotransferase